MITPTLTKPETVETKEISMEEFMKMMRSGNPMAVVELSKVEAASDAAISLAPEYRMI